MTNEELIEQIRFSQGDKQELLLQLYEQNKQLISKVIKPYLHRHAAMDENDLLQEAYFGICEAVEHYDPDKGAFSTYMTHWIKASVNRPFYRMSRADSVPEHMVQKMISYNRIATQYRQQTGTDPPDYIFRINLQLSQEQLERLRKINDRGQAASLSDLIPGTDGVTIADMIPDQTDMINDLCDDLDAERDAAELWHEVDQLDPRQAQVLRIRCQDNLTVREIADQMQLTPGKVNDAIKRGCQKLARKKTIRRIAKERGFLSTNDMFGGGLKQYLHTGTSCVEKAVIRKMDGAY